MRWIHDRALLIADADTGEVAGARRPGRRDRGADIPARWTSAWGRLFRTLIEHSREAVTIVDEGSVFYQNPSMGRVVGRPPEWSGKTRST